MADGASFSSGNWVVKEGSEEQFVSRWTDFLEWTRENAQGFQDASLLRDGEHPRHFVSFARWEDDASQEGWMALPEFPQKLGDCRELCDEFRGAPFTRVVSV
jgi:heme-degrading monooxygenase HmoA